MRLWHGALIAGALLAFLLLYRVQKSRHAFDWRDLLIDPATGKASLNAVAIAAMLFLTLWVIVDRELGGGRAEDGVAGMLATGLATFVVGRLGAQGIAAFKPTPDSGVVSKTMTETTVVSKDGK